MTVYFDESNLAAFAARKSEPLYPDCLRMVQADLDKQFNFTKEKLKGNTDLLAWFQVNMATNVGSTAVNYASAPFPDRPLKSNTHNAFTAEQLSSIYLLEDDRMDVFQASGAVLAGKPRECIETLSPLFLGNNSYRFERKYHISDKATAGTPLPPATFCEWAKLSDVTTPLTDILIVDSYITKDPSLIEPNLKALITHLGGRSACAVNVVLYTNNSENQVGFDALKTAVTNAIRQATGKQGTFTLVTVTSQRGRKTLAEHDRTILTNYFRVYSGDTFNYWLSDGSKTTNGREISFSSMADPTNWLLGKKLVADLQANLDQLSDRSIFGAKESGFFTFK